MTGPRCRRKLSPPLLAACALWAGLAADASAQGSAASDRAVLEALYDATGGPDWIDNTNWKTAAPLGEWFGVTIDTAGRVTRLEVPGNGLAGPIPAALGELALLRNLNLGSRWDLATQQPVENTLTGPIPAELGNLANLEWLYLQNNGLTGTLPAELGDLANLERLYLQNNALTGPVPSWLGRLTSLRSLDLGGNALTGPIPAELGDLANLESLSLVNNALTGPIPAELGNLANLELLHLWNNALTGPVPSWLGRLTSLRSLALGGNELTGPIPAELASLENLRRLSLGGSPLGNGLSGPIPSALGDLANLQLLDLVNNRLSGPIPSALGDLANLQSLGLSRNPLTGPLPQRLTGLSQLTRLDISRTGACAPHDAAFQAWLATIDFRGELCNQPPEPVDAIPAQTLTESGPALALSLEPHFTDPDDDALTYAAASSRGGTVTALMSDDTLWLAPGAPGTATVTVTASDPDGLSATQTVAVTTTASAGPQDDREVLEVFYDATGGPSWTNRTNWKTAAPLGEWHGVTADADGRVTRLNLHDNGLTGPLPPALAELANLELLALFGNDLIGPIPAQLGNLAGLRRLELGLNDLTGPVPASLGNLRDLQWLRLRGNQLTGPIPNALRHLGNLRYLSLGLNDLTGPVPRWLGALTGLQYLDLQRTALTGPIPEELGSLVNLEQLLLHYAWGVSGPLPARLRQSRLKKLGLFATQACTPAAWGDWPETLESFEGRSCDSVDVTIDVAVVYTPAAREALGGAAATEARIDLRIAGTNQALAESNANVRVALAGRSEVNYTETGSGSLDLGRLADPSDGHMDEVHALRDRVGADLVSLMVEDSNVCGVANIGGAFSLTVQGCAFVHELGHNFGLLHDRYQYGGGTLAHPAYGYVNQRAFTAAGAAPSSRWATIMAYGTQCWDAYTYCPGVRRFSNPHQSHNGDPLGIAFGEGGSGATGPADAVAVLNATGPIVADWRDHVPRPNRPPRAAGTLPDRTMTRNAEVEVDVSSAFVDPDGDLLSYGVSSSSPRVVAAQAAGARVTLTAVGEGTAAIRVTATDPGGLSATQTFAVTVSPPANRPPEPVGVLPPLTLGVDDAAVRVEVGGAFRDPDGDALTYRAASSAPAVASVAVVGSTVTVTPVAEGTATVTVTATDAGGSNGTAPQTFAVTVGPAANRPPEPVGVLPPLTLGVDDAAVRVEVGGAFRDPDGDALTYRAASSAVHVVTVTAASARVTLAAVGAGTATIEVTATDPDGLSATQSFRVRVTAPFTDDPIVPGVTPVRAVHFTELRARIDILRREAGLAPFRWTDPELRARVTRVRRVHLLELREALAAAYGAAGRAAPRWTDPAPTAGSTPIRAAHLTELRAAVLALE